MLRLLIVAASLPEPVPNLEVLPGRRDAYVDLAWPDLRIAIEYDGTWHFASAEQRIRDAERRELLADAGWLSVHAHAADLFTGGHSLIARLVARRVERGAPHGRSIDLTRLPRFTP